MKSELIQDLLKAIRKAGGQKAFALQHKLSESYVSDLIHARRGFSNRVALILGYERRFYFVKAAQK